MFNNHIALKVIQVIHCDGTFINHAYATLYCQGDNSTGLHSYVNAETIINNGEIQMPFIKNGLYLINSFVNNSSIEIGSTGYGIINRAEFEGAGVSSIYVNGRVETWSGSNWIHRVFANSSWASRSACTFRLYCSSVQSCR